jgi:hypothetical protein
MTSKYFGNPGILSVDMNILYHVFCLLSTTQNLTSSPSLFPFPETPFQHPNPIVSRDTPLRGYSRDKNDDRCEIQNNLHNCSCINCELVKGETDHLAKAIAVE